MAFVKGTIANLCKQMEKDGAAEGGANRPASNASDPDLKEVHVITTARQSVQAEEAEFEEAMLKSDREASEITQRIQSLEVACASHLGHNLVEGAFQSSLAKHGHTLEAACADEMDKRAALNYFKTKNEIKSPAQYPEDRLFHFSLLILFIALETGVNAFFYEGSAGLLGGAIVALAVSVINMGIAVVLGALFRYSNLPDVKNKILGYGSLVVFLFTGIVLNLIFSTFRIQYQLVQIRVIEEGLPEASTTMLVTALRTAVVDAFSVFHLNFPPIDFMSFTLFFVGFGCSVIAFWKGYTFDDKYPGHGDIDRAHKKSEKVYKEAKELAFSDAMNEVRKMEAEVETLRNQIVTEQRNASALKAQAKSALATLTSTVKTIQGELTLVLEAYRAANRANRATTPPPYFANIPNVLPDDDGTTKCEQVIAQIDVVEAEAKALADSRAKELGDRLNQIRQQINILAAQEFQKQMNDIQIRAQNSMSIRGQVGN